MKIGKTAVFLLLATMAYAKSERHYDSGVLLQMDSVSCGMDENDGKSVMGDVLGTDSGHKKQHELLCQEYLLETDKLIYRIRPRDEKHPALLPVGEKAEFRIDKDKMILRVEDGDDKERQYLVVSMTPRHETDKEQAAK
jgi:hypothetical protein